MRTTKRGKGRSIVQPGQTLYHFFKNAPQQQNHGNSKFTSQKEIIVIDSDSDSDDKVEESSTRPAKRCRLSDVVVDVDLTLVEEDWDDDRSIEFNDNWLLDPPLEDNSENPLSAKINQSDPLLQVSHSSSCMVTRQTLVSCDGNTKPDRNNAFSILMSSVKETEAWKEASIDNTKTSSGASPQTGTNGRRKVPFYKVLQGMPIAVDAFNFGKIQGVTAYFLTSVSSTRF